MIELFACIGFISFAFVLCLAASEGIIEGTVRRLTAHRLGLAAYHEARRRALWKPEELPPLDESWDRSDS